MEWIKRIAGEAIFATLLLIIVDILPFGFKVILPLFALIFLACLFFKLSNKLLVTASLFVSLFVVNLAMPLFMQETYYRPHERLAKISEHGFKRYAPDQDILIENSYGDLAAIAVTDEKIQKLREMRDIRFRTDKFGYRNHAEMESADLLLIGDSFVVGTGVDEREYLSAQLDEMGISNYNLGHNGDIQEYLESQAWLKNQPNAPATKATVLFAFEGNDFMHSNYCVQAQGSLGFVRTLHRRMKELHLSRYLAAIFARLTMRDGSSAESAVESLDISDNQKALFMRDYILAANANEYDVSCLKSLLTKHKTSLSHIYFIPTKFRTYAPLLPQKYIDLQPVSPFSQALAAIADELGIAFTDLTERFQDAARENLKEGKLIFWRDDTHWNQYGIRITAEAVRDWWNSEQGSKLK